MLVIYASICHGVASYEVEQSNINEWFGNNISIFGWYIAQTAQNIENREDNSYDGFQTMLWTFYERMLEFLSVILFSTQKEKSIVAMELRLPCNMAVYIKYFRAAIVQPIPLKR